MKRKLTEDEINEIIHLINNGKSVKEISKIYGVVPQTVYYHLNKKGIEKIRINSKRHNTTIERLYKARHLYSQGKSIQEIAKTLGVKESTVKRYLNGFINDKQGRRKKVDASVINRVLRLIMEGHDYDTIGKQLNISPITLRKAIRSAIRNGAIPNDKLWLVSGVTPNYFVRRKIIELLKDGLEPVDIAKTTGVPLVYINKLCKNFKKV